MRNVIAFANGKGGVGKTSLTANFAGLSAVMGRKVLAVDLDPQGNLGADLGYENGSSDDGGRELLDSIVSGRAPRPIRQVRPQLDVVAGGATLDRLIEHLADAPPSRRPELIGQPIRSLAGDYDLVAIDCPPTGGLMLRSILSASDFVVVPTRRDLASIQGLARVAREFAAARQAGNPGLSLLGVVLFDFGVQDTRIHSEVRDLLEGKLGAIAPVYEGFIRQSRRASMEMRRRGILAHEYESAGADRGGARVAGSITGLASDYVSITRQILAEHMSRVAGRPAADPWEAA